MTEHWPTRRKVIGDGLIMVLHGMQEACDGLVQEASERGIVYDIHGEQLESPPGSVKDIWAVRTMRADGYARNFDEMRRTVDELGSIIAREEMDEEAARRG